MKNHEPRSAKWIARELKSFKRNHEVTQTLLTLVDVAPIPSIMEIETWTDEQCLLADDWARCCHFSASDNNNRVPAIPEHLKLYRPDYPLRTPPELAAAAVKAMSDDNCVLFRPDDAQRAHLEDAMAKMRAAGCHFTDAEIDLFAAGELSEMDDHFKKYAGFEEANSVMVEIFEEAPTGVSTQWLAPLAQPGEKQ